MQRKNGMEENRKKYVTTWGNAISIADRRPENYAKDLTLRYPVRPMFDGEKIKITLVLQLNINMKVQTQGIIKK